MVLFGILTVRIIVLRVQIEVPVFMHGNSLMLGLCSGLAVAHLPLL